MDEAPDDDPAEAERTPSNATESETGPDADEPAAELSDEPTGHAVTDGVDGPDASETGQEYDLLSDTAEQDPGVTSDGDGAAPAPEVAEDVPSAPRLGKGELRAQVEEHLREHPYRSWTPTAISKVLNRLTGAINACVKLSESGAVTAFTDKPIRFQWNGEKDVDAS